MTIYYIEVNLICIIIMLLFRMQFKNRESSSTDQRILGLLIWGNVWLCFSDMLAGILRGMQFYGARTLIEISNLMYFEAITLISFLWGVYVQVRLTKSRTLNKICFFLTMLPFIVFTLIVLVNPYTHILFRINSANLYERNVGVYLHWIVVWTYFLIPSIKTLKIYLKETSRLKKQEIAPLLYFMIAPMIASVIQMIFYGVTSTQVGITISIVMICLSCQDTQILTDALTGINNRRGFDYYLANSMQHNQESVYTLVMIDVDSFKHINDRYGHMTGDLVLQGIASALKEACKVISNRLHLCRFGGDEFVILGVDCSNSEIETLKTAISTEMNGSTESLDLPCQITVSIGIAVGHCHNESDLKEMLNKADEAMYEEKKSKKSALQ